MVACQFKLKLSSPKVIAKHEECYDIGTQLSNLLPAQLLRVNPPLGFVDYSCSCLPWLLCGTQWEVSR